MGVAALSDTIRDGTLEKRPTFTIHFNLSSTGKLQWTVDRECVVICVSSNTGYVLSLNKNYVAATVAGSSLVYSDMISRGSAAQVVNLNHHLNIGDIVYCDGTATLALVMVCAVV